MNKLWKITSAFILLTFSYNSLADSPVWQVTKSGKTVYLGGTVHVLSQSDYPLPKAFETAYEQAATLVFEMDMSQAQTQKFQQAMMKELTYQDGRTYADELKPETVNKLNQYMATRGIPASNMQVFKPAMLSIALTMFELQRLKLSGTGVDAFYAQRGLNDSKQFLFLEKPEEQINYLANMGKGHEDELINYTLNDMDKLPTVLQQMKDAWRSGDGDKLFEVGGKEWQQEFPKSYQQLIIERNNNWMPHIEQYFNTSEVEFVLVGAMHLVGKDGLIEQLQSKGYKVTQL
ncbi:TraB/GumN family protein [Thalassomonas sp. M1454]|uniref:TraB/GumN family protein n=1 Tax=Thalassomonas sp. M1454 TaxID=2594477 RepID=UPI0011800FA5|nr:TraB/GumN family protein [Thalassomonas sp. M1454]TRX52826.1 TraB/GumN family protein [Thalassomonas sp. M1454]